MTPAQAADALVQLHIIAGLLVAILTLSALAKILK